MTNLRNPLQLDDFKTVTNVLHRAIKRQPHFTLQELQNEMAIALGARSLEAFQAFIESPRNGHSFIKTPRMLGEPKFDTSHWCILTATDGIIKQDLYRHDGFWATTPEWSLKVMSTQQANEHAVSVSEEMDTVRVVQFDQAFPELSMVLKMTLEQLKFHLDTHSTDDFSWSEFKALDLTRKSWQDEAFKGDTQVGYYDWLANQFEHWVSELDVSNP
jgi:hypothetical protein